VLNKGITIRASQTPVKKYLPRLIEHLQNQVLTPRDIITHRLPLDCAADAYRMFSSKLDGCIKPILLP
jgi:threonine dehydrogenase-like Zn-dependent dehydrogenase